VSKGVNEYVSNTTIMWLMMLIFYQKGSLGSHHAGVSFVYNDAVNLNLCREHVPIIPSTYANMGFTGVICQLVCWCCVSNFFQCFQVI